jgi:hypothetical protein
MKNTFKLLDAMRSMVIIALVLIVGFSMIACKDNDDDDPPPQSVLYGTWKYTAAINSIWRQITISENKIELIDSDEEGYTIENITWAAVTNDGSSSNSGNSSEYPNGFSYTGTITSNNGYSIGTVNTSVTKYFFLNDDKTKLWNEASPIGVGGNQANPFVKQ